MYCKLFASLYQGTLRGHSHEILVFTNLLATCDKEGVVDKHYRAIAEEVGLTVEEVKASILILESPDPESRSHELDGARLVRMDEHRDWGWRVVNYLKYRAIREEDDRREQNRLSQKRFREKRDSNQSKQSKPTSATVSPGNPIQKHQAEETSNKKEEEVASLPISIKEFQNQWKTKFKEVNGKFYISGGLKEIGGIKSLLSSGMEVSEIFGIAVNAWRHPPDGPKKFARGHSLQIASFCSQFNIIRDAFGNIAPKIDYLEINRLNAERRRKEEEEVTNRVKS